MTKKRLNPYYFGVGGGLGTALGTQHSAHNWLIATFAGAMAGTIIFFRAKRSSRL